MIGRARTSGSGNAPTAPASPMTMATHIVTDEVTHVNPTLTEIWTEVLSIAAGVMAIERIDFTSSGLAG